MKPARRIAVALAEFGIGREILLGFHSEAMRAGWVTQVFNPGPSESLPDDASFDAVLVGPYTHEKVVSSGWKGVIVAAEVDLTPMGIPSVRVDDLAIGRAAADHLLSAGYRTLTAYGMPHRFCLLREQGARQRVAEVGGQFVDPWLSHVHIDPHARRSRAASIFQWLDDLPRPAGILVGCDPWGRDFTEICRRAGVRIPDDFAVVGVDNDVVVCQTSTPPLSSVAVPWRRLGAEAARLMATQFQSRGRRGGAAPLVLVPPNGVVVRQSSDAFAVSDPNVSAALQLIRDRAADKLEVSDLLKHVPVSRHVLQRAFRRHVGRSMVEQIRHVRVERAKTLLASTDLTMPDIASQSGFSSAAKLSVMFRRETGMTPGEFRRARGTSY